MILLLIHESEISVQRQDSSISGLLHSCKLWASVPVLFLLITFSCDAAKKKPKGTMIGPTGLLGEFHPTWPKKPTEIKVTYIEKGSPASFSDMKVGDVIVGYGKNLFKRHPLWDLSDAYEEAEANQGSLSLLLKGNRQVTLSLSKLGAYSITAPYECQKTDGIIKRTADKLASEGLSGGPTRTGLLGLMATGEKKYIDVVAKMIHEGDLLKVDPEKVKEYLEGGESSFGSTGWQWGYNLIALGEYFLLTKDEKVIPAIKTYALGLAEGQDGLGLWGHRMARGAKKRAPGYGVMNQPSLSNLIGMLIAKRCGVKDPALDKAIQKTYSYASDIVGRGGFSYGSGGAYPNFFNNNGTSGSGAIAMLLNGNREGARFFSQIAATSYDSLTSGHASSFFNPLWTPLGASLSGPEVTQKFFKRSLWYFSGERHWKGGFPRTTSAGAVAGQALLMYCLPRKALLITGREADSSIYVKGEDSDHVILRSKTDYSSKSISELFDLLNDEFIQVRLRAKSELVKRSGGEKNADSLAKKVLGMLKEGSDQNKINVLSYLQDLSPKSSAPFGEIICKVLVDSNESISVRVAAATALSSKSYVELGKTHFKDIILLVLEESEEADPFGRRENTLSKVLTSISKNSEQKALDIEPKVEPKLLYRVANKFLGHKRQNVRAAGAQLALGIPKEDFYLIGENLLHVLRDEDPDYHSYSNTINVPGITILAELNIKEGLEFLVHGIFHGGGKWGFKYRSLMQALPHYGANAEPYIEKFESHRSINKPGDRFTPAWQKVVKKIREDKSPAKLISYKEAIAAGLKK